MKTKLYVKSLICILEFMGLYTLIFIVIGIFHLSFNHVSPEILGSKESQVILASEIVSSHSSGLEGAALERPVETE